MSIKPVYTTTAQATGGRDGRVSTSDNALDLTLAVPKEMGGTGQGNNPEQLFAAGYAACYIGAMKYAASQDKSLPRPPTDLSARATVGIGPREDGGFELTVALEAIIPGVAHDAALALAEAGHKVCPYSHATRGNIEVTLTVVES
ncbi:organic hydroperoxide resistance protein [Rhodobacteraceae bacterium]|nr:organic hydroperoxide resistance protein [Paracoccaceae bacterium]